MRHLLPLCAALILMIGCSDTISDADTLPVVGAAAPNFTQNDTSGAPVTLAQFKGKVVLIDFWASWCAPCVASLPHLKDLWSRYRDRGLVILSVSLDRNLGAWREFIRTNNLDWVHVSDGQYWNNAVARQYRIYSIPAMYLVARDGTLVTSTTEGAVLDDAAIEKALD